MDGSDHLDSEPSPICLSQHKCEFFRLNKQVATSVSDFAHCFGVDGRQCITSVGLAVLHIVWPVFHLSWHVVVY